MKNLIYLLPFLVISCVSKSDYKKLQSEKVALEHKIDSLELELSAVTLKYEQIIEEKRLAEIEQARKKFYTETQALGYIRDYFSFYNKDTKYRNVRLRRTDINSFKVSLETCTAKGDFSNSDFFWASQVLDLEIANDGTYKIQ